MHVVIIGNGISGITAARFIRKHSDFAITVISNESDEFFSRTALMYVYMGHMRLRDTQPYEPGFWKKNRIDRKRGWVQKIDQGDRVLYLADGERISYDRLIIATGSRSNKFGWPGQDLDRVHGLYHLQDLEAMEAASAGLERAVIVGGGLIGVEMAEMFHSRHIPVTFLVRETSFWDIVLPPEESAMINRHLLEQGIDLRLNTELREVVGDEQGRAVGVITQSGEEIACGFVGLTAGVSPNIGFLQNSGIEVKRGVLVDENLQTNIPGIYAVGDCAEMRTPQPGRRPIEAVWYTGRMMGETVAHNICNPDTPVAYNPGIWFNSAKFFDIEYQVYGDIRAQAPANHRSLYWEHPDGRRSIRIVYDAGTEVVLGFNVMGIRYRHEVCQHWLAQKATIETVLCELPLANFDPEFFPAYEAFVLAKYAQQTGKQIQTNHRRGLREVLTLLGK
ncbi:MAG: NAD(P)/FAD-dependent oxidoreductase [Lewinellaceae bacterium]|nr:NAD(P)/FAD-dependent oxidoreductase [Lewinellaceae bacterium]